MKWDAGAMNCGGIEDGTRLGYFRDWTSCGRNSGVKRGNLTKKVAAQLHGLSTLNNYHA